MDNPPTISVITPTLNNGQTLEYFLKSIRNQDYPQDKIEILILDGGSTDDTKKIAERFQAKIYFNEKVLADPGVDLGIRKASGEIMMILAADNIYKDKEAFSIIAKVFQDPFVYAAFPRQESERGNSLFTKYINIFTDPFNHFVYGAAANARTFHNLYRTLEHNDVYDIYDYDSSPDRPLIAFAQGFTIRNGYKREEKDALDDLSPVISLIAEKKEIAYIHSLSIYHDTVRDFDHFIRKQKWATRNALSKKQYGISHRLHYLSSGQKMRTILWPFYAFSIVLPAARSLYGLMRDGEVIWLLHPFMCFVSATSSSREYLNYILNKEKIISRQ